MVIIRMSNDGGALIVIGSRDLRAFYCYFFSRDFASDLGHVTVDPEVKERDSNAQAVLL